MAFDNTSRNQLDSAAPAVSRLDMNHLAGSERNVQKLCATMDKMQNAGSASMSQFPDLQIVGSDSTSKSQAKTDAGTQPGNQSWKSHMNEQWVQDALKSNPGWHAMEGLHPGEIAVGNWEPSKQEKKILGDAVDKMLATGNDGPLAVTLPDGSICTVEIKHNGHGGTTFSKGSDQSNLGSKHRKMTYGGSRSSDDSDAPEEDCDATTTTPTTAGSASPTIQGGVC
jgi:hypothetical protein